MNILDIIFDDIIISKLVDTKTSSKYLIGYLDKVTKPLVLVLLKMSGYVKTFKVKDNNKSLLFRMDDDKLLEKPKTI